MRHRGALAIDGASVSHQTAFEQHMRSKNPQGRTDSAKTSDAYLSAMYSGGVEPTPMEIRAVSMQVERPSLYCGKTGHVKADCRLKDAECKT